MRTKQFIMSKVVTKLLNHWTYLMQLCCVLTDRESFKWLDMRSRAINISSFCLLNERMLDALLPLNSGENNYKKLTRLDAKTSWRLALEFGGMWTCVIFSMGLGSNCQSQMTNCHPSIIDKCGSARLLFPFSSHVIDGKAMPCNLNFGHKTAIPLSCIICRRSSNVKFNKHQSREANFSCEVNSDR